MVSDAASWRNLPHKLSPFLVTVFTVKRMGVFWKRGGNPGISPSKFGVGEKSKSETEGQISILRIKII
jgi:hypothetical protein